MNLHVVVVQQGIEQAQVRRFDLDLRHGGDLLRSLYGGLDGRKGKIFIAAQGRPQGILHGGLALAGRQLQDPQVLPRRRLLRVLAAQRIVGHAKMAGGEQVLAIDVVGKGAGLADQRVDDVPIVDGVLAGPRQPRHALDDDARVPHRHLLQADHDVHLPTDQAAGDRIRVPQDVDRAPRPDGNVGQPPVVCQPARRERTQRGHFFGEPLLPVRVPRGYQFSEEPLVLLPAGEVAAATHPQGLVHPFLEVPVRRLRVAILVRLADVDPLPLQAIVRQEVAIPLAELPFVGEVVHRRGETVAAVPLRYSSQFPERVLQALAQRLEGLRRTECDRLPVRVGQREVIRQMGERLAGEGHPQAVHVREIGGRQVSGAMDLSEYHRLIRAL